MNELLKMIIELKSSDEKLKQLDIFINRLRNGEKVEESEIYENIIILLGDDNEFVRIKMTEVAEFFKGDKIVDRLCERMMNDTNYFVRGFAAKALGTIGNIRAKGNLEMAMSDKEGFVVSFASQALKSISMKCSFSSKLDMLRARVKENQKQ